MVRIQDKKTVKAASDDHAAFADRLKYAAKKAGGYSELARRAEIGRSTLFYYLKEGDPTRDVLRKIADAAQVDFTWLGTGRGATFGNDVADGVLIPIIATKDGDAAAPIPYLTKRMFGQLSREVVVTTLEVSSPAALVAFRVQDQYMQGTVWPGEWVVVDTGSTTLQDGVYCILIGQGIVVRHITYQGKKSFLVRHEVEHREQRGGFPVATQKQQPPIRIIGRVVVAGRYLGYQ